MRRGRRKEGRIRKREERELQRKETEAGCQKQELKLATWHVQGML